MPSRSLSGSGQPSSSSKPSLSSGSFGHLSLTSGMPSLSLSGSGQPSSSSKPSLSSGSLGHLSRLSRMPSLSLSGSGQPSSSSKPSLSSGSSGHLSTSSLMPSPSRSPIWGTMTGRSSWNLQTFPGDLASASWAFLSLTATSSFAAK